MYTAPDHVGVVEPLAPLPHHGQRPQGVRPLAAARVARCAAAAEAHHGRVQLKMVFEIQGDHSGRLKPPVDIYLKVVF